MFCYSWVVRRRAVDRGWSCVVGPSIVGVFWWVPSLRAVIESLADFYPYIKYFLYEVWAKLNQKWEEIDILLQCLAFIRPRSGLPPYAFKGVPPQGWSVNYDFTRRWKFKTVEDLTDHNQHPFSYRWLLMESHTTWTPALWVTQLNESCTTKPISRCLMSLHPHRLLWCSIPNLCSLSSYLSILEVFYENILQVSE